MNTAQHFKKEFSSLHYVCNKADRILLIAHSNPDPDTVGSVAALKYFLEKSGKHVDITCRDPFPEILTPLLSLTFIQPENIHLNTYDAIIASDSVERGPLKDFQNTIRKNVVTILIDHHLQIDVDGDIRIIDSTLSSSSEIMYEFFLVKRIPIEKQTANALLLGILFDTGNLQHPCTSTRVLEICSNLLKGGASLQKIVSIISANKKLSTLKLWGRALNKTRYYKKLGYAVTTITEKDFQECDAQPEEVPQIAQVLSTIPGIEFSLVLQQSTPNTVRGSLRAQHHSKANLCELAKKFGGGGHRLASGFELSGILRELPGNKWVVE